MTEVNDGGWIEMQERASQEVRATSAAADLGQVTSVAADVHTEIVPADQAAHALGVDTEVFLEG